MYTRSLQNPTSSGVEGPLYSTYFTLQHPAHWAQNDPEKTGSIYGVSTILRNDLYESYNVAVGTVLWDQEGHILVVELESKSVGKAKVVIFNVFGDKKPASPIPYRDPETGRKIVTRLDRSKEFRTLLAQECKMREAQVWDVLLAGSMNVTLSELDVKPISRVNKYESVLDRQNFNRKLQKHFDGVDIWREMNGNKKTVYVLSAEFLQGKAV